MLNLSIDFAGDDINEFVIKLLNDFKVKNINITNASNGWPNISFTFNEKEHNDRGSDIMNEFDEFMCEFYSDDWKDYII